MAKTNYFSQSATKMDSFLANTNFFNQSAIKTRRSHLQRGYLPRFHRKTVEGTANE